MSYAVNSPEFSLLATFELRRCLTLPLLAVLLLAVLLGGGCASVAKDSPESKDSQSSLVAGDVRKAREEREQKFLAEFEERRDTAQYHAAMSMAIHATAIYRPALAISTSARKTASFSRITPAMTVMGSPIKGTQLSSKDHFPHF